MRIILDTDPGVDDAVAIMWLLALDLQYHAELAAVTTTAGNLKGRHTFHNACRLLGYSLRDDVPVAKAAPHPGPTATHIHGADGLAGMSRRLPKCTHSFDDAPLAPKRIMRLLNRDPDEITLIAIGPLTNLAAAEKMQPGTLAKAHRIIIMGGAFQRGNVTPEAEFNAYYNPAAFHKVLHAGARLVIVPLDITRQLDLTVAHLTASGFGQDDHRISLFLMALCKGMEAQLRRQKTESRFFVHDACAIAFAFYPDLFETVGARIDIAVRGEAKFLGKTSIMPTGAHNALVARKINADGVRNTMLKDLLEFSARLA